MKIGIKELDTINATHSYTIHIIDDVAYVEIADEDDKIFVMPPSIVKSEIMPALRNFCKKYDDTDIEIKVHKIECPF